MSVIEISKTPNIVLAAGSISSPIFELIPVPLYRGQRMVLKADSNGLRYKFGDASVTMSINPTTGASDADGNLTTSYIGVPYGASHILIANTGNAIGIMLTFASEL